MEANFVHICSGRTVQGKKYASQVNSLLRSSYRFETNLDNSKFWPGRSKAFDSLRLQILTNQVQIHRQESHLPRQSDTNAIPHPSSHQSIMICIQLPSKLPSTSILLPSTCSPLHSLSPHTYSPPFPPKKCHQPAKPSPPCPHRNPLPNPSGQSPPTRRPLIEPSTSRSIRNQGIWRRARRC